MTSVKFSDKRIIQNRMVRLEKDLWSAFSRRSHWRKYLKKIKKVVEKWLTEWETCARILLVVRSER